jgi:hypothetical protein
MRRIKAQSRDLYQRFSAENSRGRRSSRQKNGSSFYGDGTAIEIDGFWSDAPLGRVA